MNQDVLSVHVQALRQLTKAYTPTFLVKHYRPYLCQPACILSPSVYIGYVLEVYSS